MALVYSLSSPISVGSLNHQVSVSSLKLTSISINYQDVYANNGHAVLSVCLVDPLTNYPVNVMYQDESALEFARLVESLIGAQLFQKLQADGKLPLGALADVAPAPVVTTPPVTDPAPIVPAVEPTTGN